MWAQQFKIKVAIDVDGPCAALIEGFLEWFHDSKRPWSGKFEVKLHQIKSHNNMGSSPDIQVVDQLMREWYPLGMDGKAENAGFGGAFLEFMRQPDVYSRYVRPMPESQDAVELLKGRCDCLFVTALMKRANQHVPDKLNWIGNHYPGVSIATVPSEYKCWVIPTFGIDDRYDTCWRWLNVGTTPLMFSRPWSEAPAGTPPRGMPHHDWQSIIRTIEGVLDRMDFMDRMGSGHA